MDYTGDAGRWGRRGRDSTSAAVKTFRQGSADKGSSRVQWEGQEVCQLVAGCGAT